MRLAEVDFQDRRAVALRASMVAEMNQLYGRPRHAAQAEDIDPATVIVCLLALDAHRPVATATLRRLGDLLEIKRMYIEPASRGSGLAARLLAELEARAATLADRVVLHTGERQRAAIRLYERSGYLPIDVYPPYDAVPESLCFTKRLGE